MITFLLPEGHPEYEYDVRGLLSAFYPGREIVCAAEAPAEGEVLRVPAFSEIPDRSLRKNRMKQAVYTELSRRTGRTLPWGTLTGVRPAKLISGMLEEGLAEETIRRRMRETYLISEEKLDLALSVAREEAAILGGTDWQNNFSLYVGIPFCPTRCLYCSFASYPIAVWKDRVNEYLGTLIREMRETAGLFPGRAPDTVYLGGGTPTSLSPDQLDVLLTQIGNCFDLSKRREFTVEAGRPDSITAEKLAVLKEHGVDRISVNPQTMNDATLRRIGRLHRADDVEEAFAMARSAGFENINMDMILGLPGESPSDVAYTLEKIADLAPDSLTVHALAVKRASRLKMEAAGTVVAGPGQEASEEMMRLAVSTAARLGMVPYYLYRQKNMAGNLENVGFSTPGKAGLYNILMMEERQSILALGAGTISKRVQGSLITRCDNVKEVPDYLARIEEMIERKRQLWR